MSYSITRTYWFSAAHMLVGHPKCGRMHGHNYQLDVTVAVEDLHTHERKRAWVMDFKDLDKHIKPLVKRLDHYFIETMADELKDNPWGAHSETVKDVASISALESTAEALAEWFGYKIGMSLSKSGISVERIDLWEGPKSKASWTP